MQNLAVFCLSDLIFPLMVWVAQRLQLTLQSLGDSVILLVKVIITLLLITATPLLITQA